MDFGEIIDQVSMNFPDKEKFNLASQMCRAADSIALNITEGSIGQSNPEQKIFIGYSIRSLAEKAKRRNYVAENEFIKLY